MRAIKSFTLIFGVLFFYSSSLKAAATMTEQSATSPKQALERLIEGNKRFINEKLLHPNRSQESREALKISQSPFATVLGCSDSRVSPEILFDQGIGDLFIVRVAGNVSGAIELDSIEYSVEILGSSLLLVLGHEGCGAIQAVIEGQTESIPALAKLIQPAVLSSKKLPGNAWENAVKANVAFVVEQLKNTPVLSKFIKSGKLGIVGGYYHLKSGEVEITVPLS